MCCDVAMDIRRLSVKQKATMSSDHVEQFTIARGKVNKLNGKKFLSAISGVKSANNGENGEKAHEQ